MPFLCATPLHFATSPGFKTVGATSVRDLYDLQSVMDLLRALHEDNVGTDVVFVVQGHRIPAHRSVLMVQSPVFHAMFRHDLAEKATGEIEIQDYSANAVRQVCRVSPVRSGVVRLCACVRAKGGPPVSRGLEL